MNNDCIHLRGLTWHAFHGVNPEETVQGQKFIIDADVYLAPALTRAAARTDDIAAAVSYAQVAKTIKSRVTEHTYKLIETLAERIAADILAQFACEAVRVEVHKPQAPVKEVFGDISVEIYRTASPS